MAIVDDADAQTDPRVRVKFADIRAARGSDFLNDLRRVLTSDPGPLEQTWATLEAMILPGALHPIFRVGA